MTAGRLQPAWDGRRSRPIDQNMKELAPRILYADDSPLVRLCIQYVLADFIRRLDVAVDGRDALELAKAAPADYACVFTDHSMPRMDGLQLVRALRGLHFDREIIVISSFVPVEDMIQYASMGVSRIFEKECAMRILPKLVRAQIGLVSRRQGR